VAVQAGADGDLTIPYERGLVSRLWNRSESPLEEELDRVAERVVDAPICSEQTAKLALPEGQDGDLTIPWERTL
jgi:hypothetical protein